MKKEETIHICERCGVERRASSPSVGPVRRSAPYPRDWRLIWKKMRVCPKCAKDFDELWAKYLSAGVVQTEKSQKLIH